MKSITLILLIVFVPALSRARNDASTPPLKPATLADEKPATGSGMGVGNERWVRPVGAWFEFYADGTCRSGGRGVEVAKGREGTWKAVKVREIEVKIRDEVFLLKLNSPKAGVIEGKDGLKSKISFEKKVTKPGPKLD